MDLGGRLDIARYHDPAVSPRVGLIYQPTPTTALKFLYGRAFRNPSIYEQFYSNGTTEIGNPALRSEQMQTFEGVFEKQIAKKVDLSADIYHYGLGHLIVAVPQSSILRQYQNAAAAQSMGFEVEASGKIGSRLKADASLAVQKPDFQSGASVLQVNSAQRVGKLLLDGSFFRDRLWASGDLQYVSERGTLTGSSLPPVYLVNFSLTNRSPARGVELQFGIRNALNRQYWDAAAPGQPSDRIEQDGRSFFVRVSWGMDAEKKQAKQNAEPSAAMKAEP